MIRKPVAEVVDDRGGTSVVVVVVVVWRRRMPQKRGFTKDLLLVLTGSICREDLEFSLQELCVWTI